MLPSFFNSCQSYMCEVIAFITLTPDLAVWARQFFNRFFCSACMNSISLPTPLFILQQKSQDAVWEFMVKLHFESKPDWERVCFFLPSVTQHAHQLMYGNDIDMPLKAAKDTGVPERKLSWDIRKWLYAASELSSKSHSSLPSLHFSPMSRRDRKRLGSSSAFNPRHKWLAHLAMGGN